MMRILPKRPERATVEPPRARTTTLAAVAIGLVAVLVPVRAEAATAGHGVTVILFGNDLWYNYDFLGENAASNNVDWGVSVLFTNNATIDRVKNRMEAWAPGNYAANSSNRMHLRLSNDMDSAWGWDADAGKKTVVCPAAGRSANHYRVYSTSNGGYERLYNTTLGYNVIATTHRDHNECGGGAYHDGAEVTEDNMRNSVSDNTSVQDNYWGLYNDEPYRVQGNHYWNSNGRASTIRIP